MLQPHPPHPLWQTAAPSPTHLLSCCCLCLLLQVLPQVLPEVQPKLPEECREPSRHEAFSGETRLPASVPFLFLFFFNSMRNGLGPDFLTSWKSLSGLFCKKKKKKKRAQDAQEHPAIEYKPCFHNVFITSGLFVLFQKSESIE